MIFYTPASCLENENVGRFWKYGYSFQSLRFARRPICNRLKILSNLLGRHALDFKRISMVIMVHKYDISNPSHFIIIHFIIVVLRFTKQSRNPLLKATKLYVFNGCFHRDGSKDLVACCKTICKKLVNSIFLYLIFLRNQLNYFSIIYI